MSQYTDPQISDSRSPIRGQLPAKCSQWESITEWQNKRKSISNTYVWRRKKIHKIPWIFGGFIVILFNTLWFLLIKEKDISNHISFTLSSAVSVIMQRRPPESASLNWHTALWWLSIMANVRSKEFQRKDALNIFLTGKQVHTNNDEDKGFK